MKYDGGPAFPVDVNSASLLGLITAPGMSLRDYLAAAVLTGIYTCHARTGITGLHHAEEAAKIAYEAADAMISEREKEE